MTDIVEYLCPTAQQVQDHALAHRAVIADERPAGVSHPNEFIGYETRRVVGGWWMLTNHAGRHRMALLATALASKDGTMAVLEWDHVLGWETLTGSVIWSRPTTPDGRFIPVTAP